MKPHVVLTPEAEADLDRAFGWYEEQLQGLGHQFLASVEDQFQRILQNPRISQRIDRDVRRGLTRRFPYAVYYLSEDETVVVLAVLHQARDPDPRPVIGLGAAALFW